MGQCDLSVGSKSINKKEMNYLAQISAILQVTVVDYVVFLTQMKQLRSLQNDE